MGNIYSSNAVWTKAGILNQLANLAPFTNPDGALIYNGGVTTLASTINTLRSVLPNELPALGQYPRVAYFGLGTNGYYVSGTSIAARSPDSNNGNLYRPIPMRIAVNTDLAAEIRDGYRMRQVLEINGTTYYIYWFKKLEIEEAKNNVLLYEITGETIGEHTFAPKMTFADEEIPTEGEEFTSQIVASMTGKIVIQYSELIEAVNNAAALNAVITNTVIPTDVDSIHVSELGLFTGVDKEVTVGDVTYNEAIYSQLAFHRCSRGIELINGGTYTENISLECGNIAIQ